MEEKGAYVLKNVVQHFGLLPVLADPRPFYYGALALQSVPVQMWAGLAQASGLKQMWHVSPIPAQIWQG